MDKIDINMIWNQSDPRYAFNKYGNIVILRPAAEYAGYEVGTGHVNCINGYSIITSFNNRQLISENENWEEGWLWTFLPDFN